MFPTDDARGMYKVNDVEKPETQQNIDTVEAWWSDELGQCVLAQEREQFDQLLQYFHGYYQLQIGVDANMLPEMAMPKFQKRMARTADVMGSNESLPFKSNSVDLIVLAHALEFSSDPHQVLRDADRALVGDGTMIICCFNPWSAWGVRRLFSRKMTSPWQGHFFGKTRLKDWLALLNFDVVACDRLMYRLPVRKAKWLEKTMFLEKVGARFWPVFGGVTVLVATKRTVPLTPISTKWRTSPIFTNKGLVTKPATREKINGPS